jgi:hypothetical protein
MIGNSVLLVLALLAGHGGGGHKNLLVVEADHKALDRGMKSLAKGLGVKCTACHVKGKFDSDDVAAKRDAREFFRAVLDESDQAKKKAALETLLRALKLEAVKDETALWKAVSMWHRKKSTS